MPRYVRVETVPGLQKRLIDEITGMMRANGKKLTDLARESGLGKSYVSLLLHGRRAGTMATWDLLIRTCKGWGVIVPQRLILDGYDRVRDASIDIADVDDSADSGGGPSEGSGPPPAPNAEQATVGVLHDTGIPASTQPPWERVEPPPPISPNPFRPQPRGQ